MATLVAVYGETGSGKSDLAERWASLRDAQLVNFDAFQMYRGFSIGTNKPAAPERYALMDNLDPREQYGVGQFIRDVIPLLEQCFAAERDVVMVGGTGFYARALLDGWTDLMPAPDAGLRADLEARSDAENVTRLRQLRPDLRVDWSNPVRVRRALERALTEAEPMRFKLPPFTVVKVAPKIATDELDARLAARTRAMLDRGWVDEVRGLLAAGFEETCPAFRAIGYIAIAQYLEGRLCVEELEAEIVLQTRRYAKRQRTWLRGEKGLRWLGAEDVTRAGWPGSN